MAKNKTASPAPVAATEAATEEQDLSGSAVGMIDLSGVPDEQDFPVIPRGIYPAVVDDLTYGLSQASGNPMWTWKFELTEAAGVDGNGKSLAGRKLFFHTPFVENMLPRVKKVLSRIAPELLQGPFNAEEVANSGAMIGKECRVRVDIKPYEGKPRNNVRDVLPMDSASGSEGFLGVEEATGTPA
jgi:hypothetical protein